MKNHLPVRWGLQNRCVNNYCVYPSDLTDKQWHFIKERLPEEHKRGRPRVLEMRLVVNAILYIVVGGIQWRMLPQDYPNWQSVYYYFRQWRERGVWQRLHDTLRALLRQKIGKHKHPTAACLDAQSVKASEYCDSRGFDGGKLVKGRKRHLLVDTLGLVLAVIVTSACVQDRDGARLLLRQLQGFCKKLRLIWVDGGYRGELMDWVSERFRFQLRPVVRPKGTKGFVLLPRRWVVERTFAWLSHARRLTKDYERKASSSEVFIYIAMIRLMLKRLA